MGKARIKIGKGNFHFRQDVGKKEGRCLLDICDMYDLDSIINEPTRISATKESCLDLILTNAPAFVKDGAY